jgi:Fic family protein
MTPEFFNKMMKSGVNVTDAKGRYLHWDKMRHAVPPEGFSPEEYWCAVKFLRSLREVKLPILSKEHANFGYVNIDYISRELHWLDQHSSGIIEGPEIFKNKRSKKKFLVGTLIEEAFRSSQLEGASTTRSRAKEMILRKQEPETISDRMVYNNYSAMEYIKDIKDEPLSLNLMKEIHSVITDGTLENKAYEGAFRDHNDIRVEDKNDHTVLHTPPSYHLLEERLGSVCDFINHDDTDKFVHPVLKAIILHFMIGYEHPFEDGNGRTARALFYWFCMKHGYWLMEFLSISGVIKEAPIAYSKAYLYTENDGNDLTYFILHQISVVRKAIENMMSYIKSKSEESGELEEMLVENNIRHHFNSRQLALLRHMFQNSDYNYSIYEHQSYHNITYQTARSDLLKLSDELKLLRKVKLDSKTYIFIPYKDLKDRLQNLNKQ